MLLISNILQNFILYIFPVIVYYDPIGHESKECLFFRGRSQYNFLECKKQIFSLRFHETFSIFFEKQ